MKKKEKEERLFQNNNERKHKVQIKGSPKKALSTSKGKSTWWWGKVASLKWKTENRKNKLNIFLISRYKSIIVTQNQTKIAHQKKIQRDLSCSINLKYHNR